MQLFTEAARCSCVRAGAGIWSWEQCHGAEGWSWELKLRVAVAYVSELELRAEVMPVRMFPVHALSELLRLIWVMNALIHWSWELQLRTCQSWSWDRKLRAVSWSWELELRAEAESCSCKSVKVGVESWSHARSNVSSARIVGAAPNNVSHENAMIHWSWELHLRMRQSWK